MSNSLVDWTRSACLSINVETEDEMNIPPKHLHHQLTFQLALLVVMCIDVLVDQ